MGEAQAQEKEVTNEQIAEALQTLDWSRVSIGHKAVIKQAAERLVRFPQPEREAIIDIMGALDAAISILKRRSTLRINKSFAEDYERMLTKARSVLTDKLLRK